MFLSRMLAFAVALGVLAGCNDAAQSPPASRASAEAALPFDQADLDKSGALSTQEAVLVPGLDLLAVDRDRDGMISREEYEAWVRGDRGVLPDAAASTTPR